MPLARHPSILSVSPSIMHHVRNIDKRLVHHTKIPPSLLQIMMSFPSTFFVLVSIHIRDRKIRDYPPKWCRHRTSSCAVHKSKLQAPARGNRSFPEQAPSRSTSPKAQNRSTRIIHHLCRCKTGVIPTTFKASSHADDPPDGSPPPEALAPLSGAFLLAPASPGPPASAPDKAPATVA